MRIVDALSSLVFSRILNTSIRKKKLFAFRI
jgi:hypothetical protein